MTQAKWRCFLFCLAAVPILIADEPEPIFRANTRIVEVSVLVTDRNGPVFGLMKEDFVIRDNGKLQPIAFFTAPRNPAEQRSSELSSTNNDDPSLGSSVIVLDWLNTPIDNQLYARLKTIAMLEQITIYDQVSVGMMLRQLKILHDFTDDIEALIESAREMWPSVDAPDAPLGTLENSRVRIIPGLLAMGAIDQRLRDEATHDALMQIVKVIAGRSGRRSLIWVSNRTPLRSVDTIRRLHANNVAFYLINARGVSVQPMPDPNHPGKVDFNRTLGPIEDNITADTVESTGGRYFRNRNDLDRAMREALDETRQSYTLGYYVPSDADLRPRVDLQDQPTPRIVRVEIPKRKLNLRYRKSYDPSWIGR